VLAVWNPRPNVLALGAPGESKSCDIKCAEAKPIYHPDLPMVVLDQAPKPSPLQFEVPDVAPGVYLVVMYDGSEGGRHYTWNEFEVTTESGTVAQAGRRRAEESHIRLLLALGIVVVGAGAGWLLAIRRQEES
jgi:hypothetical protein